MPFKDSEDRKEWKRRDNKRRTKEQRREEKRRQRARWKAAGLNASGKPYKTKEAREQYNHPEDCICYDCLWGRP